MIMVAPSRGYFYYRGQNGVTYEHTHSPTWKKAHDATAGLALRYLGRRARVAIRGTGTGSHPRIGGSRDSSSDSSRGSCCSVRRVCLDLPLLLGQQERGRR